MSTIIDKYAELLLQGMPLEEAWLKANDGVLLATEVVRGLEGYLPEDCQPSTRKERLKENWERRKKGLSQIAYPGLPVLLREESLTEEQFLKEYLCTFE